MTFLSVAERELRVAARQRATYRIRWIIGLIFLALLLWTLWIAEGASIVGTGPTLFRFLAFITFLFCLVFGAALPADCLSRERREGTLGLLFLTNLSSAEVVAGKTCSSALTAFYGLLAVFPLLAVSLLLGGVPFDEFWRLVLALLNALFSSVALGTLVSAISTRQFPAIAWAIALALFFSLGLFGIAEVALRWRGIPGGSSEWIALLSPTYAWSASDDSWRRFGVNRYWMSLGVVWIFSWLCLACAAWWLSRSWRDRGTAQTTGASRWRIDRRLLTQRRNSFRRRLLDINPFFWLGGRRRVSSPVFLLLAIVVVLVTVYGAAPFFSRLFGGGTSAPLQGHMFAWFWGGLGLHALVFYYAAMVASRGVAEDKQNGALELIFSTPLPSRSISRGLWLAYGRRMFAPVLIVTLVHGYFLWLVAHAMVFEDLAGAGITPGELLRFAWLPQAPHLPEVDWHLHFLLRVLTLALPIAIANWFAIGWVGRWLGLRMKRPGFAPLTALVLVLVPPWLLFSLICYLANRVGLSQMPSQRYLTLLMWVAFAIGVGHAILVSAWAATRLRRDFRATVTGWFPERLSWRDRLPSRRMILRYAAGIGLLALLVPGFYGCQNWRSHRAWTTFERDLKSRGETLDLAATLPEPVPDAFNLARSPRFLDIAGPNRPGADGIARLEKFIDMHHRIGTAGNMGGFNAHGEAPWIHHQFRHLAGKPAGAVGADPAADRTERLLTATALLTEMEPLSEALDAMTEASFLPYFQWSTDRSSVAVLSDNRPALTTLERWQFLYHLRACARLATGHSIEAGDDLLTSLRLAGLASQSPDLFSSTSAQVMSVRSLQPLWEGLAERKWNGVQLAEFQAGLAAFDFLSDYTNAVQRLVLSHIELWRQAAEPGGDPSMALKTGAPGQLYPGLEWQPRGWWLDRSINLHRAGRRATERVDVAAARVQVDHRWHDLGEFPLDHEAYPLLQQWPWYGSHPALVAFAQTAVNQGILACALERHFVDQGVYPDHLNQLISRYLDTLPNDIMTGRPLLYRRTEDGRYELRGVGPNGILDKQPGPGGDDWVWTYAISQQP